MRTLHEQRDKLLSRLNDLKDTSSKEYLDLLIELNRIEFEIENS